MHRISIGYRKNRDVYGSVAAPRKYYARCSCGWLSYRVSTDRSRALAEGGAHVAAMTRAAQS